MNPKPEPAPGELPGSLHPPTPPWSRAVLTPPNVVAGLLGGAVVALVWVAVAAGAKEAPAPGPTSIVSEKGELKVWYMIETSPGRAEGSEIAGVTRIDFQPGRVLVQTRNGAGQIFLDAKTRSLSWHK